MLPKSYIVAKWTVYALATLALSALQRLVLDHISLWDVTPFIFPMLPALVASYEGLHRGGNFALVLGLFCDLLLAGPFAGFYTITFAVIGLLSGQIGENVMSPGWLCGFTVSAIGLALVAAARLLLFFISGELHLLLMSRIALVEIVITLPLLLIALPIYRWIHARCATDY